VLEARGVSTCRIDGSHSAAARAATIAAFGQAVGGPKVLLCSLRAAGVGLNLTRANRAFMMDLWWNPSVEDQAMDRVHRIGQARPVKVVRFVTRHTVEQRILELQEHKRALSRGALARLSAEEIRRTRLQDLCRLFEGFDAGRTKELALQPAPTSREETPAPHKTPATAMLPQGNPHLSAAELEQARREVAPMLVD